MENEFTKIAALIGDPTRATILWTLLDGRAFTATELAIAANTSPQNISMHLNKLLQAGLLSADHRGRHRYYGYSRKEIAYAIEAMTSLIPQGNPASQREKTILSPVKYCRTCYDHLAGKVGVAVTDRMLQQKIITDQRGVFIVSNKGEKWFGGLGIDMDNLRQQRRSFLRPCLDWSERQYHMAGSLAAALLDTMLAGDWIRKTKNSRAIVITAKGEKKLYEHLKLEI